MELPALPAYRRALQTAVRNNTAAFGFSVVITGSLAVIADVAGPPDGLEVAIFGAGAVASFSVVDLVASEGFRRALTSEPPEVIAHASAVSFASVLLALGTAIAAANLVGGFAVWAVGPFAASTVFLLVGAFELAVAERVDRKSKGGKRT